MVKHSVTLSIGTLLLIANTVLRAAETLDTITITESASDQTTTTGDVEHSEFTGVHRVIKNEQIERRDVAIGELLSFEAGIQSHQVGGLGTFSSISIRASNSNQTAVYLDGVKLNSGGQASIDFSALELLNVEAIDVYRGGAPLQLGYGSMGGAVNLKTLHAANEPTNRLLLSGGSFYTGRLQATHQSRIGRWDVIAAAGKLVSENDFLFLDDNGTQLNQLDDKREPRNNAAVDQTGLLLRTGYRWSNDSDTKLLYQFNDKDLGVPEWRNARDNRANYQVEGQQLQLTHTVNNIRDWNSTLSLYQHDNDSHFDDIEDELGLTPQNSFSENRTLGGKVYAEKITSNGTFGITTEVRNEQLDSHDALLPSQNYAVKRDVLTSAVQYAWFNTRGNLLLTPALFYQQNSDRYDGISRRNKTTHSSNQLSPQFGVKLDFNSQLSLRANLGQYHREPAFYELFGSRGLIQGNENLKAERGVNADIGFSYSRNPDWQLDATVFASERSDLITTEYDSLGVGHSVNADKANVLGLELEHSWQSSHGLGTHINFTWQDTRNISNTAALNGNALPGEASLSAFARLAYKQLRYRLWAEAELKQDRFYDLTNLRPAKDTALLNIGIDWYGRRAKTSFAINNIGDDVVEDFNGYPRPGRAFFITTTLKL